MPQSIASDLSIVAASAGVDICRGRHAQGVRALLSLGQVDQVKTLINDDTRPTTAQVALARRRSRSDLTTATS